MGKHVTLVRTPEPQALALPPIDAELRQALTRQPLHADAHRVWAKFKFALVCSIYVIARVAVRARQQLMPDDLARIVRVDPLETNSAELKCQECGMPWTPIMRKFVDQNGVFSENEKSFVGDFFVIGAAGVAYKLRFACSNPKYDKAGNPVNTCHDSMRELLRGHGLTWKRAKEKLAQNGVAARLPGQR